MFVHPGQIVEVGKRHAELGRVRLVIDNALGEHRMRLYTETGISTAALQLVVVDTLRNVSKLRGEVVLKATGELANDDKVIENLRKFD